MADFTPVIETMEHRWMRAWVNRDVKALKAITASNFILLTGSKPPAILDRPSWLEAVAKRWDCSSYRFGDILVRREGAVAVFSAPVELKATLDGRDWSGTFSITDYGASGACAGGNSPTHRLQDRRRSPGRQGDQVAAIVEVARGAD